MNAHATLAPASWVPRGVGVYLFRQTREWSPKDAARQAARAREARVRWVVLCAEAEDGWRADLDVLARVAETYRELASARVWLYGLHAPKVIEHEPERAAERLCAALHRIGADGLVFDSEKACKGRPAQTRAFVRTAVDRIDERHGFAVTSYPLRELHPTLPWEELAIGVGQPQIYATATNRRRARRALEQWRAVHGHGAVVPLLAAYDTESPGEGAAQLRGDLRRVCVDDEGRCDVPGLGIWADPQLDQHERRVLAEWSDAQGW